MGYKTAENITHVHAAASSLLAHDVREAFAKPKEKLLILATPAKAREMYPKAVSRAVLVQHTEIMLTGFGD